jgi:hypothetical protein
MPRHAGLDAPGVHHHVMARGMERRKLFRDALERVEFIDRLEEEVDMGRALGVSPQSLYAASSRVEGSDMIKPADMERWCR